MPTKTLKRKFVAAPTALGYSLVMYRERIAIVDEKDHVIGGEQRGVVRTKGLRHRISRVFLVNSAGEILLHRRSEALRDNPGKWDQSVGGHVDEGEDYITAARRETREELGIEVGEMQVIGKFYSEREASGGMVRRFQTIFTAVWDGPVDFEKSEISEVKWFTMAAAEEFYLNNPGEFTKNFYNAFKVLQKSLGN